MLGRIVDQETGEIIPELPANSGMVNNTEHTQRVVVDVGPNRQVVNRYRPPKDVRNKEAFAQVFIDQVRRLIDEGLTPDEGAFLFFAVAYLRDSLTDYQGYIHNPDGSLMKATDVDKLMGWHKDKRTAVLNSLEARGVILRVPNGKNTHLRVNPRFVYRGRSGGQREQAILQFEPLLPVADGSKVLIRKSRAVSVNEQNVC